MPPPRLNRLVIRADSPERTARFFAALGLSFDLRRQGVGPEHPVAEWGGLALEIFPTACSVDTGAVRLGFDVESLDAALEAALAAGGTLVSKPRPSLRGRRAVVADPDGRRVDLLERSAAGL